MGRVSAAHEDPPIEERDVAPASAAPDGAVVTGMTDLLVKAVRALGAAGEPEQASRLAGKAWWVLKDWPRHAERINGTMHYLARLEQGGPDESAGRAAGA